MIKAAGVAISAFIALISVAFLAVSCGGNGDSTTGADGGPQEPFPHLGSSAVFAALGAQNVVNNGSSIVYGDIGISPGNTMTGVANIKMTGGSLHEHDSAATQAQSDAVTAYNNLYNKPCDHDLSGQDLGGMTLTPGAYCFSGNATLNGVLTLDAQGNPNGTFVFQINGTLTSAYDSLVQMTDSGESCYVFWQVAQSAELGASSVFAGSILSVGSITMDNGSTLNGKVVSRMGSVTLNSSQIYDNTCPW